MQLDDIGLIPLHHAARYGHVECVKLLLQTGTPVSARSSQRMTALHYAAASGSAAVAEVGRAEAPVRRGVVSHVLLRGRCCSTAGRR